MQPYRPPEPDWQQPPNHSGGLPPDGYQHPTSYQPADGYQPPGTYPPPATYPSAPPYGYEQPPQGYQQAPPPQAYQQASPAGHQLAAPAPGYYAGYHQPAAPAAAPPPYLTPSQEAQDAVAARGRRDIIFGVIWLAVGLSITLFTLARFGPYVVVAWGPALYGIYKIIKGAVTLQRGR